MIGWMQLSRQAVARAEQALRADKKGVRDEIGFLALHQAFAEHFFPGTSVLHTRLRYVLLVPWLMQRSGGDEKRFRDYSLQLTKQLKIGGERNGVIGGDICPREPVQSVAMIYWSALARWKILRSRADRVTPTRTQVLQGLATIRRDMPAARASLDGEAPWSADISPFVSLPCEPKGLLRAGVPLTLTPEKEERVFLRRQLRGVLRPDGSQSLLARLAESDARVANTDWPWQARLQDFADAADKRCLVLAKQASALAGIGRAVYLALVEKAKNRDTQDNSREFRDELASMRLKYAADANALDLAEVYERFPELPADLRGVLEETQRWLNAGRRAVDQLEHVYRTAETSRKGSRARLGSTLGPVRRRAEWNTPQMLHPLPEPLHYRWFNVRQLLMDLQGG